MTRRLARTATVLAGSLLALPALATAASAAPLDDLPGSTSTFTVVDGILIFGVAPVAVYLLIALLVMRPGSGSGRTQRYRPGRDWTAAPSWSGLRPDAGHALPAGADAVPPGSDAVPVMDGAPEAEHADSRAEEHEPVAGRGEQRESGGARGSW